MFSVFEYHMTTKQALAIVVDVHVHAILLDHDHAYVAYVPNWPPPTHSSPKAVMMA